MSLEKYFDNSEILKEIIKLKNFNSFYIKKIWKTATVRYELQIFRVLLRIRIEKCSQVFRPEFDGTLSN